MIIDIHGHYTTEPPELHAFRKRQLAGEVALDWNPALEDLGISDEMLIHSVQPQLQQQHARGYDLTLFSPRAAGMAHHLGTEAISRQWSRLSNDLIHRVCHLLPGRFAPVAQLPQSPGIDPERCVAEIRRTVLELGFVGVNLNPDPTGGYWTDPPLTDPYWFPIYETLSALDVPAMIHVSSSCNPNFHHTGAHYLNGDTSVFMQLLAGDLFQRFPNLRFVIPHGGGAVPFHWGRYRGLAQELKKPLLQEHLLRNVFFDTCIYHLPGVELIAKVIPVTNILFASEMLGAVKGIDPQTGHHFDDTKRYIDQIDWLDAESRHQIFEGNARRVYPRLAKWLEKTPSAENATGGGS